MSSRHILPGHIGEPVSLSLLDAATRADEAAVLQAILSGADVNALDASGRWNEVDVSDASYSLPTRLRILKILLTSDKISLYALNAPQLSMHGVTPLGLAAWLNIPQVVKMLLDESSGLVAVDGMDALGATPLMYAARDGNTAVVQSLLTHGARPDFRDVNHRTSIQQALRHPQVLWLCESALRRHRARETIVEHNRRNLSQPHPELDELLAAPPHITCHPKLSLQLSKRELQQSTSRLVSCIKTTDVQQLYSFLFAPSTSSSTSSTPYLVNYPDADGWSAIHHCASQDSPSPTVLDMLYRAGADMSLYSRSGQGTPLHILARSTRGSTSSSIQAFVWHMVVDLRAPLSARNEDLETCIHVAAEHGQSIEVLMALLACDTTGAVRELRNSRGLTALEVANPLFRSAFGPNVEQARSTSAASARTIKPSIVSVQTVATHTSLDFQDRWGSATKSARDTYEPALTEFERATLPQNIVDNLRSLARQSSADQELPNTQSFEDLIEETRSMGADLLKHMADRVAEARGELSTLNTKFVGQQSFVSELTSENEGKACARLLAIERVWDAPDRRRTTDSDDSDRTAVSTRSQTTSVIESLQGSSDSGDSRSVIELDVDPFARLPHQLMPPHSSLRPVKSMVNLGQHSPTGLQPVTGRGSPMPATPWKGAPSANKPSSPSQVEKDWARSSASKVKAWFKKKFVEPSPKMPLIQELDEKNSTLVVAHPEKKKPVMAELSVAETRAVFVARADLARIRESLAISERNLTSATRYISQAGSMLNAILQKHMNTLERTRLARQFSAAPSLDMESSLRSDERTGAAFIEFPPITIPSSPRDSQLVFPRPPTNVSPKSSVISFSSTLADGDDEDPAQLRSLLTHKIERRIEYALAEIEKSTTWLRIVRDVTRPLRRRTVPALH
ncbi:ankyrin [Trametopsis cervina]|nr:ankyrin [Trametopsis cervina]